MDRAPDGIGKPTTFIRPLADKDFQSYVPPYISALTGLSDRLVTMRKKQIALTTLMILLEFNY